MNPFELTQEIEQKYRDYLKTTFYFKDRELWESFERALKDGEISKGPYLEATPVFKRGVSPEQLFTELGIKAESGFFDALRDRLYPHQENAIRRVNEGQNIVVATGTGSGKTEAFLYPILISLYQEFLKGELGPGVRALILYPMNALANDQRERLGVIGKILRDKQTSFNFTFGQYIGETPEDEADSFRHAQDHVASRLDGELVFRADMRKSPPNILLTNFSMLEYLLLRPDDSPLFDDGRAKHWKFIVLDEAHQYRGSQGIEMAMLLRRLKQRLTGGGRQEGFNCIATSATLVGGESDKSKVANFASELFGEHFGDDGIILGETEPVTGGNSEVLQVDDYQYIRDALLGEKIPEGRTLTDLETKIGISFQDQPKIAASMLLKEDKRATSLRLLLARGQFKVSEIAKSIFSDLPEDDQINSLIKLVEVLLLARLDDSGTRLLSVRYHFFLRSLEGAFVSYWPQKEVYLERGGLEEIGRAFEVALCRECGQHYFVGSVSRDGKLVEAIRDPSHDEFGALYFLPLEELPAGDEFEDENQSLYNLCLECAQISRGQLECNHNHKLWVLRQISPKDEDKADQMSRCGACGYNAAGRDPVREIVHGADGPNAVITTTLYRNLKKDRNKILAFADGRQEAAFFAWYLEDWYQDILSRNLVLKTTSQIGGVSQNGLSLRELAVALRETIRREGLLPPAAGDLELHREGWKRLYQEFLTEEQRVSLEGVGLGYWDFAWPEWVHTPSIFLERPWSLSEQEARDITFSLFNTMRIDRAIELKTEKNIPLSWADLNLRSAQSRFRLGEPKGRTDIHSWDGKKTRRVKYLSKLLNKIDSALDEATCTNIAIDALRQLWENVTTDEEQASDPNHKLLYSLEDTRRLNPDWWRFHVVEKRRPIYRCDTCGRFSPVSVKNICANISCKGKLKESNTDSYINFYQQMYTSVLPSTLRIEEHTAQLDKEKAREFQRDFRNGKINVLSCSTTFELGVDLGDLDVVFMRNVPPETFNYVQRVGRSGRRSDPGIAITYCRRGPHDLYHFSEPERMLSGKVRPPVLIVRNEKIIERHITATALSAFFREPGHGEKFKSVNFLFSDMVAPRATSEFKMFLHKRKLDLEEILISIVPPEMKERVGLIDGSWIERLSGEESRFRIAEIDVSHDYFITDDLRLKAKDVDDLDKQKWAKARLETICSEDVLSFLSRKAVIPKYGFPVDVVELDTQKTKSNKEAYEILLQRDLTIAISEFAPTSKLIANKKVWTSYGVKRVPEKEWPLRCYKRCSKHNVYLEWQEGEAEKMSPCGDDLPTFRYIEPRFGFITNREKPEIPQSRQLRVFSTRPYFSKFTKDLDELIQFRLPEKQPVLTLTKAALGKMVVLCEGRKGEGFFICKVCGAGFRKRKKNHKTPFDFPCSGELINVSLGHELETDVLQLQFHKPFFDPVEPTWLAFSLAFALVEGAAEVLEVPSTDLNATVSHSTKLAVPPIILYDNVPGGAGLVTRLEGEEMLRECLESALNRVGGNCGCADEESCYGCLRSFKNQFAHRNLRRGAALRYLESVLSEWR